MLWFALAGGVIIVALAVYAAMLVGRLVAQQKIVKAAVNRRNQGLLEDIRYIAKAMLEDRCGLSEGVIRLCNLLPVLQSPQLIDWPQRFPSVYALYDKVKELPTHEARNTLPLAQRRRQDQQREADEQALEQDILKEAKALAELNADALR